MMAEPLPQSPFAASWQKLVANGYHVLPISPMSKAPSEFVRGRWQPMSNWQQYRATPASEMACRVWSTWPDCNIGVLTGTPAGNNMVLACVDYDVDDPEVLRELTEAIPSSSVTKIGRRGFSAFYLVPKDTKGFRNKIVELLTDTRQTVLPPSIHMDTGKPYRWTSGLTLETVKVSGLPELTTEDVDSLRAVAKKLKPELMEAPAKAEVIHFPAGEETI